MFIKIKYWNVKKGEDEVIIYRDLDRETLYDALSMELMSCPPDEGDEIGKMLLTMNLNGRTEEIYFPWEEGEKVVEIYCMNDSGKTIDRYVY